MAVFKGFRIALAALFSHRLRTALATLGIVVGVSSVIVMMAVGEGAQHEVVSKIRAMGTDLVLVTAGQVKIIAGRQRQTGNVTTLTVRDARAVAEESEHVLAVAPAQSRRLLVRADAVSTGTTITGTTVALQKVRGLSITRGRFFTDDEDRTLQRVAVLGKTAARNLFEDRDPVGERVRIAAVSFEVVGVLGEKGTDLAGNDQDDVIYIPLATALRRLFNVTYINNIYVQARGSDSIASAAGDIGEILRERHRLGDRADDFTIQSQTEILKTEQDTTRTFTSLLSTVAAVSLVVGGVGILAVMLISIKERTREIGVRRAVGATRGDLLVQFLAESLTLSMAGGVAGIAVGAAIAAGAANATRWPLRLSLMPIIVAFVVSAAIGVVFGVIPAMRASRLDPIDALRSE